MKTASSIEGRGRCEVCGSWPSGGSGPEQQHDDADDGRKSDVNPEQSEMIFHG
jgi:hypothetical protein